jgi:AraC-like DNA-binding protein
MGKKQRGKVAYHAVRYIDNCPLEDYRKLNVDWLAAQLQANPSYLSRTFKEEHGCLLKDYIVCRKMDKAKELVETTKMPVKKIAGLMDYANPSYFIQVFRDHNLMTPGEHREIYEAHQRRQAASAPAADDEEKEEEAESEEPLWQIIKNRIIKYFKRKFHQE